MAILSPKIIICKQVLFSRLFMKSGISFDRVCTCHLRHRK